MDVKIAWKLLKQPMSLTDKLELLGYSKEDCSKILSDIKSTDSNFSFGFFGSHFELSTLAYHYLVDNGEINGSEIYRFGNDGEPCLGDLSIKSDGLYRYMNNEWIKYEKD